MSRSNLGTYFQTHNRLREAIEQYESAVTLTSDAGLLAQTYSNLGAAHRALGEDEQAAKNFEQALHFNASQFNAWLGLGILAQKQGKLDEAISDLSRSVEIQPSAQGYLQLGHVLRQSQRVPEAVVAYQQALKLDPDLTEARRAAEVLGQPGR
jgi:superkiller protein 3